MKLGQQALFDGFDVLKWYSDSTRTTRVPGRDRCALIVVTCQCHGMVERKTKTSIHSSTRSTYIAGYEYVLGAYLGTSSVMHLHGMCLFKKQPVNSLR